MATPLSREQLDTLRWLLDQRNRREASHPETLHHVSVELPTDNLWAAQLEAMANLRGATPEALLHRYLTLSLEADLAEILSAEGYRIGHAPRKA